MICDLAPEWPSYVLSLNYIQEGFPAETIKAVAEEGGDVSIGADLDDSTKVCLPFLLRPDRIVSKEHILSAVLSSLYLTNQKMAKMHNLKTEICNRLSNAWSIKESLTFFGAEPRQPTLLCVVGDKESVLHWQDAFVKKANCAVSEPASFGGDIEAILKHFQISSGAAELALPGGLEAAVLTRLAVKGI